MNTDELYLTIGHDSRVLAATDALCDLIAHPPTEIASKSVLDFIYPEDHKTFVNAFIDISYGEHGPKKYQFRLLSTHGSRISVLAIFTLKGVYQDSFIHVQLKITAE